MAKKDLLRAAQILEAYQDDISRIGEIAVRGTREDIEGYRQLGRHLRKGEVRKAGGRYLSEVKRRAKRSAEMGAAVVPLATRMLLNPFEGPEGLTLEEYAKWRRSANYYITDMMGDIPEFSAVRLRELIAQGHPMSWQCKLELEYRKERRKHKQAEAKAKKNGAKKPVPRGMSRTPRSAATSLYVFPERESFPVGDLFHAKTAVEWSTTWPNLKQFKNKVLSVVSERYPQYDWKAYSNELEAQQMRSRRNPQAVDLAEGMMRLLGQLRALQWLSWTTHWVAKGPNFYSDHKLLQRLYEGKGGGPDIQESIDALGERMVYLCGEDTVDPVLISRITTSELERMHDLEADPLKQLLLLEVTVLRTIEGLWAKNQKKVRVILALDDFFAALANERATVVYLLNQRLK